MPYLDNPGWNQEASVEASFARDRRACLELSLVGSSLLQTFSLSGKASLEVRSLDLLSQSAEGSCTSGWRLLTKILDTEPD